MSTPTPPTGGTPEQNGNPSNPPSGSFGAPQPQQQPGAYGAPYQQQPATGHNPQQFGPADPTQQFGPPTDTTQQFGSADSSFGPPPSQVQQPGYGAAPDQFQQTAYGAAPGQQPAYAGPGGPGGPFGGPGGPGGWGEQPKKSKTPWIVGGALVALIAIAATVLIIVLNKDDEDTAGDNNGGTSGGAEITCEEGQYGAAVDPETGDIVECNGEAGTPGSEGSTGSDDVDPEVAAIEGTWTATTTITSINTDLSDGTTGQPLVEGDSLWGEQHEWMIQAPFCTAGDNCQASVLDTTTGESITLEQSGSEWIGTSYLDIDCEDGTVATMEVSILIAMDDSSTHEGYIDTTSDDLCGTGSATIGEDLLLTKN